MNPSRQASRPHDDAVPTPRDALILAIDESTLRIGQQLLRLLGNEQAGFLAVGDDVIDGLLNVLAILTTARQVSLGHESEPGERGDGGGRTHAVAGIAEAAVGPLV